MYTFSLCSRVWHTEVAMAVIDKGADLNARANDGWTPLHVAYALRHRNAEVVMAVIDYAMGKKGKRKGKFQSNEVVMIVIVVVIEAVICG